MKKVCDRFLRTMKAVKLKLGTHMNSGLMCHVYQNQGQWSITHIVNPLIGFTILPLMKKNFVTLFSRTVRVTKFKLGTHMDSGMMYCVYQNQCQKPITHGVKSLDRLYNLP